MVCTLIQHVGQSSAILKIADDTKITAVVSNTEEVNQFIEGFGLFV